MESTNSSNIPSRTSSKKLALLALCLLVSFTSVSTQSFWIDEGNSAFRAIQPTLSEFWVHNIRFGGSDLQMPGYMLSLWAWEKIFGSSEYALRAMNIPFFLVAVCAILFAFQEKPLTRHFFASLLCLSPMVWIYMDEARPYILQLCGATLMLIGMVNQGRNPISIEKNLALFCIGMLILCAASLTSVVFAFFFALGYMAILLKQKKLHQIFLSRWILFTPASTLLILLSLGAYYLWTLRMGVGASNAANTSLSSLAFAFYELLGFMGLGPGRLELRSQGIASLSPFLFGLITFALVTLLVATVSLRKLTKKLLPAWFGIIAATALTGAASIVLIGIVKDFRIVGRHMMPILPFLLLFMAWSLGNLWNSSKTPYKFLVLAFLALLLTSSLSARTAERFQKDDYRSSAKLAQSYLEQGKTVWWAADEPSLLYYLPEAESHIASQSLFLAFGSRFTPIKFRKKPDLVLLSKPDIYDPNQSLVNFLNENEFTLLENHRAFEAFSHQESL
jgi:hypothetical protein